jgi:hypothetical protein
MNDKYEEAAHEIALIYGFDETVYVNDKRSTLSDYLRATFPPVPVADSVRELALKVKGECFVDVSQTEKPCFLWDVDIAAALIQSYIDAQADKKCAECRDVNIKESTR